MSGVWQHPQLAARARWTQVDTPVGPVPALWPPGWPVDGEDRARMDPIPALGQHTESILRELGWEAPDIERLRRDGVI
jgi:itaconate CoA-transferase